MRTSGSGLNTGGNNNMRKSNSGGSNQSLRKSESGGSTQSLRNNESLKKTSSNPVLKKADSLPSKIAIGKSVSNMSLNKLEMQGKRTASPKRDSSNSPPGTLRAKSVISSSTGRPITSKISSLWKKEDAAAPSAVAKHKVPVNKIVTKVGNKPPSKVPSPVAGNTPREGLSRSSTYEKLPGENKPDIYKNKPSDSCSQKKISSESILSCSSYVTKQKEADCKLTCQSDNTLHGQTDRGCIKTERSGIQVLGLKREQSLQSVKRDVSSSQLPMRRSSSGLSRLPTSEALKSRQRSQTNMKQDSVKSSEENSISVEEQMYNNIPKPAEIMEGTRENNVRGTISAIVPPFNYNPNPKPMSHIPQPDKPRRPMSYINSMENECGDGSEGGGKGRGYLVTTV